MISYHFKLLSRKTTLLLFLTLLLMHSFPALAQPTRTETEELNRRARQQAEERKQRQERQDVFLQDKSQADEDTSLPEETPAFQIHRIQLKGERLQEFSWLTSYLESYSHRRIGQQGIQLIVKRLSNLLIDRGYITTRILVPEQDLSSETLTLLLIPGTIHEIRFQDPSYHGSWQTAFPARPGDILNLRNLEQGLEQMKRVPSQDVEMDIRPGNQPGQSDVVIKVQRQKPWKAILSLDDSGSKATGRLQSSQTFAVDNLFGINDLFNVSFNVDAEPDHPERGTRGNSVDYSFPYGHWTFSFSGRSYQYHQTVTAAVEPFVSSGESDNLEFKASRLLERDQTSKTHLDFRILRAKSKSYIDDTEIEVQRKNTTAAEFAFVHTRYAGHTVYDVKIANKQGVSWFHAQEEPADRLPDDPTTRYSLWTVDLQTVAPAAFFGAPAQYRVNFYGQHTLSPLYGSEYFSIGNRYTVRGFDGEQTLSAEKGWYLRNELAIPLAGGGPEVYLGLDYGQVSGQATQYLPGKKLAGGAVGLRGNLATFQYDLFAGWPIYKPQGYQTADTTFGFQLLCQI
ncbi:ShlB/FhaC/HecB family hemolysin secretion/activation protein [Acetonema longum]|uniref:Hemolysin activation translocator protein n=1 Tax=Acetonema longum DSM 6540 TaxID=1009370 RepID=F7NML1_9FIRM|nr:ShlB/FhaC/HecB family hemolysin secretion/activation protein [Acetonema longum]EGO62719.1 hemolysin activation translocator protein [Acetonema longum DSM 6540]